MSAAALRARLKATGPDACLLLLRLSGWSAVTLLATAGCAVLLFAALGGFTVEGFFAHLDNLASRFVAAGPERRESFVGLVRLSSAGLLAVIVLCRWRSLAAVFVLPPEPSR